MPLRELFSLILLRFTLTYFRMVSLLRRLPLWFQDKTFFLSDLSLLVSADPYALSRAFRMQFQKSSVQYLYGETPLESFKELVACLGITPDTRCIDLGCGRGRHLFYLSSFMGCETFGVEIVPEIFQLLDRINRRVGSPLTLFLEDFFHLDLSSYQMIYCFGTTLPQVMVERLEKKLLDECAPHTRIITVSYRLENTRFRVDQIHSLPFEFGVAQVYVHTLCAE